ncbi:glycosyltransferase family 2 protein [Bradyrhizobium sp. McL0615]|uniref:glycosyltransferase family 2 protein n=1 Tax=Bradyrhizobium sp. McL0615 TaxID=3415673 RepID=UPI003CFA12C5
MQRPYFSVVVPTYNRLARLRHVIAGFENQAYPSGSYEVIVISDGSTDGTDAYLETLRTTMQLRWLTQANQGPAAARNAGVRTAVGEFIVFVDDDVVPEPRLLAEHARSHQGAGVDVVVLGPLLTPEGFEMAPWVRWEQEMLMKQYRAMLKGDWSASARQFYTGNASLRRSHILAVGGFDENFRRAEDVELAYRLASAGLKFVFNIKAAGMHFADRSYRAWLDMAYSYGRNDVVFARDRNQEWLLPTIHREFMERHLLIRSLVRLCSRRPQLTRMTCSLLKRVADSATLARASAVEGKAYSGLFNLQYYNGFINELSNDGFLFKDLERPV